VLGAWMDSNKTSPMWFSVRGLFWGCFLVLSLFSSLASFFGSFRAQPTHMAPRLEGADMKSDHQLRIFNSFCARPLNYFRSLVCSAAL
jgi:hypothetical protein